MAQIRWSYILVFVAFAIFMVTWHQAFQVTPTFLSQFKTETALLSEKNTCMHPVTIVSAYYPLNNSKHSLNEYDKWMANFFSYVSAPIVMYSSPGEALDKIRDLRGDLPMTVKVRKLLNTICKPFSSKFMLSIYHHSYYLVALTSFKSCGRSQSLSLIARNWRIVNTTWILRKIYTTPISMLYGTPNPGWYNKRRPMTHFKATTSFGLMQVLGGENIKVCP